MVISPYLERCFNMSLLVDQFQRQFSYLRLSITEICNFRCQYCLPNGYIAEKPVKKNDFLSLAEIDRLIDTFAELGISKIRLTGGEPTMRTDFIDIVKCIDAHTEIKNIALTTNGYRLSDRVSDWKSAGVTALNISVDSLNNEQFIFITGQDRLKTILNGIDKALACDFTAVKINTVLLKGVNDQIAPYLAWIKHRPLQLRFIELMETGLGRDYFNRYHCSALKIEQTLLELGWQLKIKAGEQGVANVYAHAEYLGEIGLIMPYSAIFCESCNRLRISSRGDFHLCLFGESGIPLRSLLASDDQKIHLKQTILTSLKIKRQSHYLHQHDTGVTKNLAVIGG